MSDAQDRKLHVGFLMMHLGIAAVLLLHALPKLFDGIYNRLNCKKNDAHLRYRVQPASRYVFSE